LFDLGVHGTGIDGSGNGMGFGRFARLQAALRVGLEFFEATGIAKIVVPPAMDMVVRRIRIDVHAANRVLETRRRTGDFGLILVY
jgi:hypothetical protein